MVDYCTYCKRKQPPVDTELIPGMNTRQEWLDRSYYSCEDCNKETQANYRHNKKSIHNQYRQKIKDEQIQKFSDEWNHRDLQVFNKDLVQKLYEVFDRNDRRDKALGIEKKLACQIIFNDWWFVKPATIVQDYFDEVQLSQAKQNDREQVLLEFVVHHLDMWQQIYRNKAINKFNGLVNAHNRRFRGIHKLIARPEYIEPITGDSIKNWYLLSKLDDKKARDVVREKVKITQDENKRLEQQIIDTYAEVQLKKQQQNGQGATTT